MIHSFRNSRFFLGLIAGASAFLFASGVQGAFTWDTTGLPGSTWDTSGQWAGTTAVPDFVNGWNTADYLLYFGASTNTNVLLVNADQEDLMGQLQILSGAPSYTFSRPNYPTKGIWLAPSNTNWANALTNSSNLTQTFGSGLRMGASGSSCRFTISCGNGDPVTGISFQIEDHLSLAGRSTNGVTINGPGKINVHGNLAQLASCRLNLNTEMLVTGYWSHGGYIEKLGSGTLILNSAAPDPSIMAGILYLGTGSSTTNGVVRIRDGNALGAPGTSGVSDTEILAGDGRLELQNDLLGNGITCGETITFYARPFSNQAVGISNYDGDNTLNGTIKLTTTSASNNQFGFDSVAAGKTLTIASALGGFLVTGQGNHQTLNFRGAGNYDLLGGITTASAGPSIIIQKYGSGTLTISNNVDLNAHSTYYGGVVVNEGVLKVADYVSFANSNFFVASGASIDTTAVTGGYYLSAQKLGGSGTFNGPLNALSGALSPGGAAAYDAVNGLAITPTAGTLNIVGDLSFDSSSLDCDLANVTTVGAGINDLVSVAGNIALSGVGTINVNRLNGVLVTGNYVLMQCTGTRTGSIAGWTINGLPDTSGSRQVFTLGANATQLYLNVSGSAKSLTWSGNGTTNIWDAYNSITNPGAALNWDSGTEKFYNGDLVTFNDTGSRTPPVDIVGDVQPASITVTNSLGNDYTFAGTGGILGGPALTKNGAGKLTIANSAPFNILGTVTVNDGNVTFANLGTNTLGNLVLEGGTLAFNLPVDTTLNNTVTGAAGNLQQDAANMLTLNLSAAGYTGKVTATNGVLRTASMAGSGASIHVTGTGTLDLNNVNPNVPIFIGGPGFDPVNNLATLTNNVPTFSGTGPLLASVTMTGDASICTIGSNNTRTMIRIASLHANGYKLTKLGRSVLSIENTGADTETNLGDVDITGPGRVYFTSGTMGDPAKTITVRGYGYIGLDGVTPCTYDKKVVIDKTGGRFETFGGSTSTFYGDIHFNGELTDPTSQMLVDIENATGIIEFVAPISGHGSVILYGTPGSKVKFSGDNTFDGTLFVGRDNGLYPVTAELTTTGQLSPSATIKVLNGAAFNVTGTGSHTMGTIVGFDATSTGQFGTMNVYDTSIVTATSITLDTLNIGGSSTSAAAVPEPAVWLLLLAGAIGAFVFRRIRNGS